jgi:hypothetical protein
VGQELRAKGRRERDAPAPGTALGFDRPRFGVEASLDADETGVEVDVLPPKRLELAAAQAGVDGGGPHGAVARGQGGDQGPCLLRARDALAPATYRREREPEGGVLNDLRARDRAAKSPQR